MFNATNGQGNALTTTQSNQQTKEEIEKPQQGKFRKTFTFWLICPSSYRINTENGSDD